MIKSFNRRIPGESKLKFKSIKRQLYRLRDKKYPKKKPKTDLEISQTLHQDEIFEEYGKNLNKSHKLYIDSVVEEKYAFHVFASISMIDIVKKYIPPPERIYLLDGTFKIVPRQFTKHGQLLIISIEFKNDVSIPH